jgi:hypothetical protein
MQTSLRIDPKLHSAIAKLAEQENRSINSQIEYILHKSISPRKYSDATKH